MYVQLLNIFYVALNFDIAYKVCRYTIRCKLKYIFFITYFPTERLRYALFRRTIIYVGKSNYLN